MLKTKIFLTISVLFISSMIYSQGIAVVGQKIITDNAGSAFYYPKFDNTGDNIVFTTDNYSGLWIYQISSGTVSKLNDLPGAGDEPAFDTENNLVLRSYRFENMKRISSMYKQDLATGKLEKIINDSKSLYPPLKSVNSSVYSVNKGEIAKVSNSLAKSGNSETLVYIDNSKIVIVTDGVESVIDPLGTGNYLWPSVSPDGSKLLFTKAGSGTFISDLKGNILNELGDLHYPVWAKDGQWVLYMNDKDDGVKFVSSDIEMINVNTLEKINLTNTEDQIEMYPDYSLSTDEVVYHTLEGRIIKLKLKFNQD